MERKWCPKSSFVQAGKGITEGRTGQNMTNAFKDPKNTNLDGEATEWRLCKPSGCRLNTTLVKLTPTLTRNRKLTLSKYFWMRYDLPPVTSNQQYRWMIVHALFIVSSVSLLLLSQHFMTYSTELLWCHMENTWLCMSLLRMYNFHRPSVSWGDSALTYH